MSSSGTILLLVFMILLLLGGIALLIGGLLLLIKAKGSTMKVLLSILMMVAGVFTASVPIVMFIIFVVASTM